MPALIPQPVLAKASTSSASIILRPVLIPHVPIPIDVIEAITSKVRKEPFVFSAEKVIQFHWRRREG